MTRVWAHIALFYLLSGNSMTHSFTTPYTNRRISISPLPSKKTPESDDPTPKDKETPLDKALRKARAKAEISRLNAEGIIDHETNLRNNLHDGNITPGLHPDSPESELERIHSHLESAKARAIENGDFQSASRYRDEIDRMHIDDCGYVLQANSRFYQAFSEKDFDMMKSLWLHCDTVQCIHPSHMPLVGYVPVVESWKAMFDTEDRTFQMNTMEPTNIRLSVKGCTAWLTCDEEVYVPKFVRGAGKTKELVKKMMATNIFRKVDGKWYLVHHHASLHGELEGKNGMGGMMRGRLDNRSPIQSTTIRLGDLGGISGGGSPEGESGPVKRVFMGSLSDFLNGGGLNDIFSGSEKGGESGGKTIIHVNSLDDDDDDDDDDDMDVDERRMAKQWDKMGGISGNSADDSGKQNVPKDALRQNCISALRKLCTQGSISQKQKRILLTDIITCSAKGEFSMVEVAYELLCGEGEDKDAAEEEFADQCRVFAEKELKDN